MRNGMLTWCLQAVFSTLVHFAVFHSDVNDSRRKQDTSMTTKQSLIFLTSKVVFCRMRWTMFYVSKNKINYVLKYCLQFTQNYSLDVKVIQSFLSN